jgi:hypothetical protein
MSAFLLKYSEKELYGAFLCCRAERRLSRRKSKWSMESKGAGRARELQ